MSSLPMVTFGCLDITGRSYHEFMQQKLSQPNPYYDVQQDESRIQSILDKENISLNAEESYIYVDDFLIHLDNRDKPQWDIYDSRKDMIPHLKAIIKTQYIVQEMKRIPILSFPFVYSGPNDIISHNKEFVPLMDIHKYRQQFEATVAANSFEFSIYARWGCKRRQFWKNRLKFIESAKNIPNSQVLQAYGANKKNVHIDNYVAADVYWDEMSRSKFAISTNGRGPWCARDMEISAIGIPMLREQSVAIMYKPFVAGTHFIEVDPKNLSDIYTYYANNYNEALVIGKNAQNYFDAYHQPDGMRRLFREIIDNILMS